MKNIIVLVLTGFLFLLTSCMDSKDDEYATSKDPQISSLTLSHDSITGLSSVKFTVDQTAGLIYNADSLPFGTRMWDKVKAEIGTVIGASIQITEAATGDTYWWGERDSINFTKPVTMVSTAYDGFTRKTYSAQLNIHQVNPDTLIWSLYKESLPELSSITEQKVIIYKYGESDLLHYFLYVKNSLGNNELYVTSDSELDNWISVNLTIPAVNPILQQITEYNGTLYMPSADGALYASVDGVNWTIFTTSYQIKAILGVVEGENISPILATIVQSGSELYYAVMDVNENWEVGKSIGNDFPVSGFAWTNCTRGYNDYLVIAGGLDLSNNNYLNKVWWTLDGLNWADVDTGFAARTGAMLTQYGDELFLIGGLGKDGKGLKDIYHSPESNFLIWAAGDSLVAFPDAYKGRGYSSLIVDEKDYMLIFGGKASTNDNLDEVWRGRLNRLGFKHKED